MGLIHCVQQRQIWADTLCTAKIDTVYVQFELIWSVRVGKGG